MPTNTFTLILAILVSSPPEEPVAKQNHPLPAVIPLKAIPPSASSQVNKDEIGDDNKHLLLAAYSLFQSGTYFMGKRDFIRADEFLERSRQLIKEAIGEDNAGYASAVAGRHVHGFVH